MVQLRRDAVLHKYKRELRKLDGGSNLQNFERLVELSRDALDFLPCFKVLSYALIHCRPGGLTPPKEA